VETTTLPELDAQYRQLREGAGYLLREERSWLAVVGADAAEYLQGQLTNDIEALGDGEGCYAALLDRKGHMQSDMRVLRLGEGEILIETEAATAAAVRSHLDTYRIGRAVELEDRNGSLATVSAIGPATARVLAADPPPAEHCHRPASVGGVPCRLIGTADGVDVLIDPDAAVALSTALEAGGATRVTPAAAEIVRVESGEPRFGAEMGPQTIPAEAGIVERAVSFSKGCYIGQETVARLHYKGRPNRHLRGLRLSAATEPGATLTLGDREVGVVGTACLSPAFGPIALAIVRREAEPGAVVAVGDAGVTAEVVELPFAAA
jgi:folate-binding protein YgfZ